MTADGSSTPCSSIAWYIIHRLVFQLFGLILQILVLQFFGWFFNCLFFNSSVGSSIALVDCSSACPSIVSVGSSSA
jgi:hypothetical protein